MFVPTAENLTESTSIALVKQIKQELITIPWDSQGISCHSNSRSIATTYVKEGNGGTPILLLHGFDSSLLEYRRLLPFLAEKKETWAVDLLGFGFSDRVVDLSYSPTTIKTHLYYFWKTLIQKPVILVGASMGGATAIDFTLTHPEIVSKLILIDGAGLGKPPMAGKFIFSPLDRLATNFLSNPKVRKNISLNAYYDRSFASLDAQTCAALHLKCDRWAEALISFTRSGGYGYFGDRLSDITQSTLILWGANDKILGTKYAPQFEKKIPNSKLVWIPECGHVPHLEKAKITAREIFDFIGEQSDTQ
jgi:pimeloyl-ACP methyl ester carboxylesterase